MPLFAPNPRDLPKILDQVRPRPVQHGLGGLRRVGRLGTVEAVLAAARRRAVDVLLGGHGRQDPLLVLGRQVGGGGQQLCRVVGARRVRVVGGVRGVGPTARGKAKGRTGGRGRGGQGAGFGMLGG